MYTCFVQSFKILASFCSWAGWFESHLVENPRRHVFARCGSIASEFIHNSYFLVCYGYQNWTSHRKFLEPGFTVIMMIVKIKWIYRVSQKSCTIWAPSSEFVSSSIPSWQISTAHAQPFGGARDLAFCLKVPLDSLLVWASSEGSGETALDAIHFIYRWYISIFLET